MTSIRPGLFLLPTLALLLASGPGCGKKGSGNVVEETREVDAFHTIDVKGAAQLKASIGPKHKVVVKTDDNLIDIVETTVTDGVLTIGTKKSYSTSSGLVVTVVTPELRALTVSGAAKAEVSGIAGASFSIDVSGAASVKADGKAARVTIDVSGSARVDTTGLASENVKVDSSGAASVKVNASKTLDATIGGAGKIRYTGDAKVTSKVTGVGSVKRAD